MRGLVGEAVSAKIPLVWALGDEGELKGLCRELEGLPNAEHVAHDG